MTNKHLVLVGAGHAHLQLLKKARLLKKHHLNIILISPTDFNYNGLAPGVLSSYYSKKTGYLPVQCHLNAVNGQFIQEEAVEVNVEDKTVFLSNGETISYDYLSFNIGAKGKTFRNESYTSLFSTRPISQLWSFQDKLKNLIGQSPNTIRVTIVGGGAAGVELAGNIHKFITDHNIQPVVKLITRGGSLLPQFPSSAGSKVIKSYQKRGIQILVNSDVTRIQGQTILLANKDEIPFDLCISATGIVPNTIESQKKLMTTPQEELIVNENLQCKGHSTIFAAGDCIYFEPHPLWKSGYHAINQGPILLNNILAVARNTKLRPYKPRKLILTALNLGDGTGIVIIGRFTYHGTLAFKIKDYIEKRFLKLHRC